MPGADLSKYIAEQIDQQKIICRRNTVSVQADSDRQQQENDFQQERIELDIWRQELDQKARQRTFTISLMSCSI